MESKQEDSSPTADGDRQRFGERRSDQGCDFIVEKTADGIGLSGTVHAGEPLPRLLRCLKAIEQLLERFPRGRFEVEICAGEPVIMRSDVGPTNDPSVMPEGKEAGLEPPLFEREDDVLESDNLIPVPPQRAIRTRKVRLIKRGKDRPQPADDPWA